LVNLYGFAYFCSEKIRSQAFFPLKNLSHDEQNYVTLHTDSTAVSDENLKKCLSNNSTSLKDLAKHEKFDKSNRAIDTLSSPGDKRLFNFLPCRPYLFIGLKYVKNEAQTGGSLILNIYEGKNFFERNKPDKFPSN
jgi:hypothetical protein